MNSEEIVSIESRPGRVRLRISLFIILFLAGIFLPFLKAFSQDKPDSLQLIAKKRANRVSLMSAILPGAGQAANKKYWKIPVIYAGGGVLFYFVKSNNDEYHKYRDALLYRTDNDSATVDQFPRFTVDDLRTRKDYYRRNRDLSYIFAGVLYVLNIVDAYVDSQLMDFDVSDNLSLRINPSLLPNQYYAPVPSLNVVFTFK